MALLETLATTAGGALSATVGVLVGGMVTRRGQDRQWHRDKQLAAYVELLGHYARFTMVLKRAHADRRVWDYDWGEWSAALTSASLVAPPEVATEIMNFGRAIDTFLNRVARDTARDTIEHPLSLDEFDQASLAPALAQLALVNAVRRSLDKDQGALSEWIGGSHARPPR
jgi:hypothetical protein